jgi:hypothetical protein
MHASSVIYLKIVQHILRYVKGIFNIDLYLTSHATLDAPYFLEETSPVTSRW